MCRLDPLLLYSGGRDVHFVAGANVRRQREWQRGHGQSHSPDSDADTASGSRHPSEVVETFTELGDEVRGLEDRSGSVVRK